MSRILIVEDNKEIRNMLIKIANNMDSSIEVESTGNATQALEILMKWPIDAFFLDIQLEDYSGLDLAKQIREIDAYSFTPIVFITAMPTRELEAFRQIHCYDYIIKPFRIMDVEKVFEKILVSYLSLQKKTEEKISLAFKTHTQLIEPSDIIYIEYINRRVVIFLKNQTIYYPHTALKRFYSLLPNNFMQIHQSIIINCNYIETINMSNKCISLKNLEKELPVGRSFVKEVGDKLYELF